VLCFFFPIFRNICEGGQEREKRCLDLGFNAMILGRLGKEGGGGKGPRRRNPLFSSLFRISIHPRPQGKTKRGGEREKEKGGGGGFRGGGVGGTQGKREKKDG